MIAPVRYTNPGISVHRVRLRRALRTGVSGRELDAERGNLRAQRRDVALEHRGPGRDALLNHGDDAAGQSIEIKLLHDVALRTVWTQYCVQRQGLRPALQEFPFALEHYEAR
jgi:hypothetical protein